MKANGLIDGIIKEPVGGAHSDLEGMLKIMKTEIKKQIKAVRALDVDEMVNQRIDKFSNMGVYSEEGAAVAAK